MILLLILSIRGAENAVGIDGYIPSFLSTIFKIKSEEKGPITKEFRKNAAYLVESHQDYSKYANMSVYCSFADQIPIFFIFESKIPTEDWVGIEPNLPGTALISSVLFDHNFSTGISSPLLSHPRYLILSTETAPPNYVQKQISSSLLPFLSNLSTVFDVYAARGSAFATRICRSQIPMVPSFRFIFLMIVTFLLFLILSTYSPSFSPAPDSCLWVFDTSSNLLYGPPLETLDQMVSSSLRSVVEECASSRAPSAQVIRFWRNEKTLTFQRVGAVPLNPSVIFAAIWKEPLPEPGPIDFDCEFTSKEYKLIDSPKITFSSLRDLLPVHINFTLDTNIRCTIDLPPTVLFPFLPNGRRAIMKLTLLTEMISMLSDDPYSISNFSRLAEITSKEIGATHAVYMQIDGKVLFEHSVIPLTKSELSQIPEKINKFKGHPYVSDFFGDGNAAYIGIIPGWPSDIYVVVSIEEKGRPFIIKSYGIPYITYCCNFMRQLSTLKLQALQYERLIETMVISEHYLFFEVTLKSRKLLTFRSNLIPGQIKEVNDLLNAFELKEYFELRDILQEAFVCKDFKSWNRHRIIVTKGKNSATLSVTSALLYDDPLQEDIATFVIIDFTSVRQKELARAESLRDFRYISPSLGISKFLVRDKTAVLEDSAIATSLNRNERSLTALAFPDDSQKLSAILNGERLPIRLSDSEGKPIWHFAACCKDVGYIFSINSLVESRGRFKLTAEDPRPMVSSFDIIFWTVDLETERVSPLFNQPTVWDNLSIDPNEKFSRFGDFVQTEDRPDFVRHYNSIRSGKEKEWTGEMRILQVGGQFEWNLMSMSLSANNRMNCYTLNIHKRKEIETRLKETKQLRDLLLSSGKLALWKFKDSREDLGRFNGFDTQSVNIVQMNWKFVDEQVSPSYRERFSECINRAFDHDEGVEIDVPLTVGGGRELWVSIRGKVRAPGRQIVGACIDITDLRNAFNELEKATKQAEEANRQKTIFLSNMSHEIRTPMNGIVGMLDVLALKELTSEQRLLVDSIRSSSFQLMKLLDDTLNMSKIEQGEIEMNAAVFNLSSIFEPICIATASRARLNHLKMRVKVSRDFPTLIYGDPQFFVQILNNLLSNALKFTKQGSISVNLRWEDEVCIIEVSDTGIGISDEQQRIIFHRFAQADASVARNFGGTGLGLSLVQEIAQFLKGSVGVESSPGKGTTFTVRLPSESVMAPFCPKFKEKHTLLLCIEDDDLRKNISDWVQSYEIVDFKKADEIWKADALFIEGSRDIWPQVLEATSRLSIPACSFCEPGEPSIFKYNLAKPIFPYHLFSVLNGFRFGQKIPTTEVIPLAEDNQQRKILVVEDNKANQFVMEKILDHIGCAYRIAEDGRQAISELERGPFDLIFMDCQMPVLDGIEATKIIRRSKKEYSRIPIVALTASAVEGDEDTCRNAGMDGYLAKPVRIQQITDMIRKFTRR